MYSLAYLSSKMRSADFSGNFFPSTEKDFPDDKKSPDNKEIQVLWLSFPTLNLETEWI